MHDLNDARGRLAELESEWAALTARITAGTAGPEDYETRSGLQSRVQAAREAAADAETRVQRTAHQQREAELMQRVEGTRREVGRLVPQLLIALAGMRLVVEDVYRVGTPDGGPVDELLGVPASFAEDVQRAIARAAPNTEWDWSVTGPGAKAVGDPPTIRPDNRYVSLGRAELPPGATGIVNVVTGEVHVGAPGE
jgi:hypothetical protein